MKFFLLFCLLFTLALKGVAQEGKAMVIYNAKGKKVSYKKMRKKVLENEFVFFGEYHDNPISHWLELELTKELFALHGSNLILGFEMFEQDQQLLLNDYVDGIISDQFFEDSCRLWTNYETDYKPIIQFAKQNKIFCLASNIPRRYASLLFKRGMPALDSLSATEKSYMTPLDFKIDSTLSQYAELNEMEKHMGGGHLLEAQAIKDATMAHFILLNKKNNNVLFHLNGAYHTDYQQGIIWYIRQKKPDANILTISTVTQENVGKLDAENKNKADFIICVPENMTRTH